MNKIERIKTRLFNSWIWYHVYWKHTRKEKTDLVATRSRVVERRNEILGWENRDD